MRIHAGYAILIEMLISEGDLKILRGRPLKSGRGAFASFGGMGGRRGHQENWSNFGLGG